MRLPFYYGWVIVGVVFVSMAIGVNARTAFSLLFPPILEEFRWDRGVTAGAFSFGFLLSAFMSPLLGRLMDRAGPRLVMEMGVVLLAAGLLLAPLTTEAWHLYATLGVLLGGGSVCLGYSGQSLFLPNWFVRKRGLATGIAFAGVGVGSIILLPGDAACDREPTAGAPRAGRSACSPSFSWRPINLLLRKRPEDMGLLPDGDAAPEASAAPKPSNVVDPAWAAIDWTLGRAMRTARFWWIAIGYFLGLYAWYAVQVHQTKYLIEIGFSPTLAAWALGFVSLVGIPGQIALGHISDRIGREWVWTAGMLGFAACYLLLLALQAFPSPVLLYLMVIAQGVLGYGVTSVFAAIVAEIFQGKHYGTIFGTVMLVAISGGAAGPWLTGVLFDTYGNYTLAFWIGVAASLASAATIWLAAPRKVRAVAGQMHRVPDAG